MFQSSPDLVVGRYRVSTRTAYSMMDVSILARLGSRALRLRMSATASAQDVSILARLGSRALRSMFCGTLMAAMHVSILARLGSRALRDGARCRAGHEFQSSPDLVVGRYAAAADSLSRSTMFQSSPDLVVGRYQRCTRSLQARSDVSILARLGSRALRDARLRILARCHDVSILARLGSRALRGISATHVASVQVSILARLGSRALRAALQCRDA